MSAIRHRPQRLLVATDFSTNSAYALARALRLPVARDAEIALLHVTTREHLHPPPSERLSAMLAEAMRLGSWHGRAIIQEIAHGTPHLQIVRRAHSFDADLILVGRHGRRRLVDAFVGTTASRVVRTASCPVLLVAGPPEHDYRRPVLAVDLASPSHRLVRLAASVLEENVTLHVVHALTSDGVRMAAAPAELADASERMAHFVEVERRRIEISGQVRIGGVGTAVLAEAESVGADLLIIGTYADPSMARVLLRTSSDSVMANASCDVLVGAPVRRLDLDVEATRP